MSIYDHPTFQMACEQFDQVAELLQLPNETRERLKFPKRSFIFSIPVRMDDGQVKVFTGYRVQHHLTLGPTKGGLRFHPDVELGEVAALAMWMSWKCALAGLPYGGAKGGVACDPRALSIGELERLTRRFTQELTPYIGPQLDIPAPDVGSNEQMMGWMMDTYSNHIGHSVPAVVTGKPVHLGGSLGRRESTGRGVAFLVGRAMEVIKLKPADTRVVIQGYGNVGSVAAGTLALMGCKIVGISDVSGGVYDPNGLDLQAIEAHVKAHRSLEGYPGGTRVSNEALLELECEVLIPAALERQITKINAPKLRCRILAEAANGPTTPAADAVLANRPEILIIPDILCNAGGVIVSYFEWVQDLQSFFWDEAEIMNKLYKILDHSFKLTLHRAKDLSVTMRTAALSIGIERVHQAKISRGLFP